jgi:hypothetical protein
MIISLNKKRPLRPEHRRETYWFQDSTETSLHRWECGLQKLTASGTGRSHRASETAPFSGSRHPGTFPARGEVSALPRRALQEHLGEPSWFPDPSKTSLCRWECGLQKLTASVTGQSNTDSGTGPVLGLHLLPGGKTECQISLHLPWKRISCLQRVLWPLKLRRELVCWQQNHERNEL